MRRPCLLVIILALLVGACGKRGALIYPDQLVPEAPTSVTLRQTGVGMRLSFLLPQKDRAGQPLADLAGARIMKRETIPGQEEECSACMEGFRLFRTLYVDVPGESVRRYGSMMIMLDSDVTIGRSYTYQVIPFTRGGVDGQATPQVTASVVEPPLPPLLRVIPSPTDIRLEFSGSRPPRGTVAGYNLYRAVKGEPLPFLPLNKEPLPGTSYTDSGLDRRQIYSYAVRTVVRMPTGDLVEGSLSSLEDGALRDDEE